MEQSKVDRLAESLGLPASELAAYESLDTAEIQHLVESLQAARQRQSAILEAAIEQALSYVPKLMRRPILRILGR